MRFVKLVLATWFGSGYFPFASGTVGTLATVPLVLLLWNWPSPWVHSLAAALVSLIGLWAARDAETLFGKKDPGQVVIDETAGYLVTTIALPMTWPSLIVSFLAFRVMDIVKPWPARQLEALPGSTGIMIDDLFAGLYANLLLQLVFAYWPALAG